MGPLTTTGVATPSTVAERSKLTLRAASSPRHAAPPTIGEGAERAVGAGAVGFTSGVVFASAGVVPAGADSAGPPRFSAARACSHGASGTSGVAGGSGAIRVQAPVIADKSN